MNSIPFLLRTLGAAGSLPLQRFRRKLDDPESAQRAVSERIARDLAMTAYGREYGLDRRSDSSSLRERLPIAGYERIESWIARELRGERGALFSERPVSYERTSGSGGREKLIPYTTALRRLFATMAGRWISDLAANAPPLSSARLFISVSPPNSGSAKAADGAPIGFEDDADYLSGPLGLLLRRFLVHPPGLKTLRAPEDYRFALAAILAATEDLGVVSVWNPTYFSSLLGFMRQHRESLLASLREGRIERAGRRWEFPRISDERAEILSGNAPDWERFWPKLRWISAWNDAGARPFAEELRKLFPRAYFQAKGLLATEGPMTFPLVGAPGGVPLVDRVFYEFIRDDGTLALLHELSDGEECEILPSFPGGFARYRVGDRIRVVGRIGRTPLLEFVGRSNGVADLVGEKLSEIFVREAFSGVDELEGRFWFLVPDAEARPPRYSLVLSPEDGHAFRAGFAADLDSRLKRALHYGYARDMGQLAALDVRVVADAKDLYYGHYVARGMKWGDVKYAALVSNPSDARDLLARVLAT